MKSSLSLPQRKESFVHFIGQWQRLIVVPPNQVSAFFYSESNHTTPKFELSTKLCGIKIVFPVVPNGLSGSEPN